ncbi:MAG: GerMN domain-containing protein, partial [Acidimicrobiales bacterium]|nr:GerMN domain-containing protein [Acidimicrobiales bacterium]
MCIRDSSRRAREGTDVSSLRATRHDESVVTATDGQRSDGFRRLIAFAVVALIGSGLAGCGGVTADSRPQLINQALPPQLSAPETTTTTTPGQNTKRAVVFLFRRSESPAVADRMFPIQVFVPDQDNMADAVLRELIRQPSPEIEQFGFKSDVPKDLVINSVSWEGGLVSIDLSNLALTGTKLRQAVAQIVFTLTELPGVRRVLFSVDGRRTGVPTETRDADPGQPIGRDDFPTFRAQVAEAAAGQSPNATQPPPPASTPIPSDLPAQPAT